MNRSKIFCLLILLLLLISCKNEEKPEKEPEYFNNIGKLVEFINPSLSKKEINEINFIVVIPNAGCDECINEAEQLLFDFKNNDQNLYFLLTTFDIEKSIYLKYGYDIKNNKQVLIDKENIFLGNGFNSIYPMVLNLDKGSLKEVQFQNPDNPKTISDLQSLLNL